jgi:basic amino acid/polyamine antiporter, APA family
VVYAVARDYPAFSQLGRVHPKHHTPTRAIAVMSAWAVVLIWLGQVLPVKTQLPNLLTNYCIFGGSIFYFSAVLAVFVLRRTRPDAARPYRTWGYPVVPGIFVVFYVYLLISMLWGGPVESIAGLSLVVVGFLVHLMIGGKEPIAAK